MDDLRMRSAVPGDTNRIAQITAGDPGEEEIGLLGGPEVAREFGMALVRLPHSPMGWEHTVVAELRGTVVGLIQAGLGRRDFRMSPSVVYLTLRTFGPLGIARLLPRFRARRRVQPRPPAGAYHIAQMDVAPEYRGQGIGAAMLDHSERDARGAGISRMSLVTNTANPARRLYERHGFRIVETKTDEAFKRYTGIAGRHLMVKGLV